MSTVSFAPGRRGVPPALIGLVAACVALVVVSDAQAAKKSTKVSSASAAIIRTGLENLEKQVKDFTLPNGLKFIVVERHQAPVFSFQTVVNAGSANDAVGTTGIAHMMEHMAFKGNAIVGTSDYAKEKTLLDAEEKAWNAYLNERRKGMHADSTRLKALSKAFAEAQAASRAVVKGNEFQKVIERAGAQNWNAFTADDITAYYYSLPSNRLELWAAMEAGRMGFPVFREFYKERDVIYEERRMRYESSPFGRLLEEFTHAAFVAHPYGFGGIGHPSDLVTFSRMQGDEFFRRNYVAKNMTVAVVGDVTVADVRRVADKYWNDLSSADAPPPVDTEEPPQRAERRAILEDPGQPMMLIGYHVPAGTDPRYPAYEALADLLGGGDYARLNKVLVKEKKIATQVQVFTGFPGERYPNLLALFVVPASGQDPFKVEQEIYAVLDGIRQKPFTADEVNGYKVRIKAQKIGVAENNANLAGELAQAQSLYGDWHEFFREQQRVQALTPKALMDALNSSLVKSNRTAALLVNPKAAAAATEGGR